MRNECTGSDPTVCWPRQTAAQIPDVTERGVPSHQEVSHTHTHTHTLAAQIPDVTERSKSVSHTHTRFPVCGMMHIKEPLLLIGKSNLCGGSGFSISLSEWSFTICLTPYSRK